MIFSGKFVMLMSCSRCNVKCKHCYISYKEDFSPDELKDVASKLSKKYNIMINGAEPLVDLRYLESYPIINQKQILTNGLALINNYDKIIKQLKENGIDNISVSYHFDMHEKFSSVNKKQLEGLFKKIISDGFKLRIMATITSENFKKIEKYCDIAYKMGAKAIKFTNFVNQGNARNLDNKLILTNKQKIEFFIKIRKARNKYEKKDLLIERCGTFGKDLTKSNDKHFKCGAGTDLVVITPDKSVYPCVFLTSKGNEIGQYKNGRIELFNNYINDGSECVACKLCNNIKKTTMEE
ncbi:MAG: radical SAM protein [Clostridiales bacterium]|nr:radical SAM protein [Clostridiales bacterium]